jgi:polysaccharide biosynthesis transport protein
MDDVVRRSNLFQFALEALSRRRWLAIATFGGVFTMVVSIVMFLPDIYRSSASLLIERQQIPEAFVKSTVTSAIATRLETMSQELLSRARLETLIARFGLYTDVKRRVPPELLAERMRQDIQREVKRAEKVGTDSAMGFFSISFNGRDPQKVALVTNTLASLYVEENTRVRERQAMETAQFLGAQLEKVKSKLDEQEQQLSKFKEREANLASLTQIHAQLRLNTDQLNRINERRTALARQLAEAEWRGGAAPPTTITPDGKPAATGVRLEQRIAELTQKLEELQTRFTDKFPDLIRLKSELASLEGQQKMKSDVGTTKATSLSATPYITELKRAIAEADTEIKVLRSEGEGLRRAIAASQRLVDSNSSQSPKELQKLVREYDATKENYNVLLKRQEEARLGESMEQRQKGEQLRIIELATPSTKPISPKRTRLLLVGFLLSLGLAAGLVVLAEQLDTSFHKVDDLRTFTRVPVLVTISQIITEADLRRRQRRLSLAAAGATLGLLLIVGVSFLLVNGNEQLVRLLAGRGL